MKKSIIINLEENNNIQLKFQGNVNFDTFTAALFTVLEAQAKSLIDATRQATLSKPEIYTPEQADLYLASVKGNIYDTINQFASLTLQNIAPEYELHPDIQTEAILRMENQIIEEEFKKLKRNPDYKSPYLLNERQTKPALKVVSK